MPAEDSIFDVAQCEIKTIDSPIGFSIKIKGTGETLIFQCADEDDQSKWMGAIFEAKLKQKDTSATADTCSVQ